MDSLKLAFRDEVKPDVFLNRVGMTALVVGGVLMGVSLWHGGNATIENIVPLGGWHSRNAYGELYADIWANNWVMAFQTGFTCWGLVLMGIALRRVVTGNKYFVSCISMGLGFLAMAFFLPACVEPFLRMIVEKMPFLTQ